MSIIKPDDWHVHLRDHDKLKSTVPATAHHFARALIMPNLQPALTSVEAINKYHRRIIQAIPEKNTFTPYMTLYLNESIEPAVFDAISKTSHIIGAKLYPAGATTNSDAGAQSIKRLYPLFEAMQSNQLVLQIHGEVTFGDIFEREARFIKDELQALIKNFPKLRVVLEHISTKAAVDFITAAPEQVAATITPHHLLYNRNHLLAGGIKPHYYCLPILKHRDDQLAIQQAAVSGNPKFFLGTDSAPHTQLQKESACGCAGIFSAPYALPIYAQVFDTLNKLERLEAFASQFGADFYELARNQSHIELIKKPSVIPKHYPYNADYVIPIAAGETLQWSIHANP